jgi:hypothetical protein
MIYDFLNLATCITVKSNLSKKSYFNFLTLLEITYKMQHLLIRKKKGSHVREADKWPIDVDNHACILLSSKNTL